MFGIVSQPVITIEEGPFMEKTAKDGQVVSAIADEGLYGMIAAVTGAEENGFVPVKTFYGYSGYVNANDLLLVQGCEAKRWEGSNLMVISGFCVDVTSVPKVQGVRLLSLFRGSLIRVLEFESETEGWAKVELADGRTGFMRNQYLREKEFSQAGAWEAELPQKEVEEQVFRNAVVGCALSYLGVQYRWGGRSTAGIDCSGLTSVCYMLNGILTYRDAKIAEGYPVHEIPRSAMKMGDLLYFPGHIAMYLGEGRYIHSTGRIGSGGVVINSLNPADVDYRKDLNESLYAVGSIF